MMLSTEIIQPTERGLVNGGQYNTLKTRRWLRTTVRWDVVIRAQEGQLSPEMYTDRLSFTVRRPGIRQLLQVLRENRDGMDELKA
jgi:hypothetical protein